MIPTTRFSTRFLRCALAMAALFHALAGCAPVDDDSPDDLAVEAVVHGTRDRGAHPAVVALRRADGALCTGTLIARDRVLTARHCVSETAETVQCDGRRDVFGTFAARDFEVVTDDDGLRGAVAARVTAVRVPDAAMLCGNDVALLVLDRALPITPVALRTRAPTVGDALVVVGYGRRGDSARAGVGERFQRANVRVTAVGAREFSTGEGTCQGDSGGPALDARTGELVGVLSRGALQCVGDAGTLWTRASTARALLGL